MKTPFLLSSKKNLVFTLVLTIFLLVSISSAMAIDYEGIGGRPAFPQDGNPRSQAIFIHTIEPGQSIDEGVNVINNTNEKKVINVYGVDSVVSSGGSFACAQQLDQQKNVGTWLKLEKNEVALEPYKSEIVKFKITAPTNASAGEQNGCIVIQEKKVSQTDSNTSGALLSFRTGLRIALLVPGEIKRELIFKNFEQVQINDEKVLFKAQVKNSGNVSIDTDVRLKTKYFFGVDQSTQQVQFPVLRDETSTWNFELDKPFWGGWYTTQFSALYDKNLNAKIGIRTDSPLEEVVGTTVTYFVMPAPLALAIEITVLLLIIAVVGFVFYKKNDNKKIQQTWVNYKVVEGESITKIAKRYNISWKKLAKVNEIKPPYQLSNGDTIKVPPKNRGNKL